MQDNNEGQPLDYEWLLEWFNLSLQVLAARRSGGEAWEDEAIIELRNKLDELGESTATELLDTITPDGADDGE